MSSNLSQRLAIVFMVGLAACAVSATADAGNRAALTDISVGVTTTTDGAPIYLGVAKGFFAKYGLNVKITAAPTAVPFIPAMVRGDMQFATGTPTNFIGSVANGIPLQFVSSLTTVKIGTPSLVVTGPDTGLKSMKQTSGATFCLPAPGSGSQVLIQAWAAKAHVDAASLKFTVAPFAAMVAAIQTHKCQGALLPSPFYEDAKAAGFNTLGSPFFAFGGVGVPITVVVTSGTYSSKNKAIVRAFNAGLGLSIRYARSHPAAVRAILPTYAGITDAQAKTTILPLYTQPLYTKALQRMADFSAQVGFISGHVSIKTQMIAPYSPTVNK